MIFILNRCRILTVGAPSRASISSISGGPRPGGMAVAEYDGPPLEPTELLTIKSGDEILGQLYNFTDKGDRSGGAAAGGDANVDTHGRRPRTRL